MPAMLRAAVATPVSLVHNVSTPSTGYVEQVSSRSLSCTVMTSSSSSCC